ncbi:hypothetical protein KU616_24325, partial [Salmonella enterica subsp. enterica serovar Mbandaka]|nr:hypothetical protein [Salmonella enterica subsp. enterica serovar Mbandaka]
MRFNCVSINPSASPANNAGITCSYKYGVIMTPHVMKRDGCKVPFKSERIKEAILRAAKAAG